MQLERRRFLERSAGIVAGGSLVGLAGCNSLSGFMSSGGAGAISYGESVSGRLEQSDDSGYRGYYDRIPFQGEAGDVVTVSMESEPGDTYLILLNPDGQRVAANDDVDFDLNSQISRHTLRSDGMYSIIATSYRESATFPYTVSLQKVGERDSDAQSGGGGGSRVIDYGQTVAGELTTSDQTGFRGYYDVYEFQGAAGDTVTISMESEPGDPYLLLQNPNGVTVAEDDDGGSGFLNSEISGHELQSSGRYRIIATSFGEDDTFPYQLTLRRGF